MIRGSSSSTRGVARRTLTDSLPCRTDRQRPGTGDVAVQPDGLLREHQAAADVHAPVLVRREHDRRPEPGPVLRRRAPQADQVRRGRTEPRRVLRPARRARHLLAPVLRRRARFAAQRGRQLRIVHRQRRPVFRRRYPSLALPCRH